MPSVAELVKANVFYSNGPVNGVSYPRKTDGSGYYVQVTVARMGDSSRVNTYNVVLLRSDPILRPVLNMRDEDFKEWYDTRVKAILAALKISRLIAEVLNAKYKVRDDFYPPRTMDQQTAVVQDLEARLEMLEVMRAVRAIPQQH